MLDAGADKPLPFLTPEDRPNPPSKPAWSAPEGPHGRAQKASSRRSPQPIPPPTPTWVMAPMVADQHEADYFVKLGRASV